MKTIQTWTIEPIEKEKREMDSRNDTDNDYNNFIKV